MLRIVAIVVATQVMASCSFYPAIEADDPDSVMAGVHVGNEVNIVSKKGRVSHFIVTRVTNKALYGEGFRVPYDEMKSIEVDGQERSNFFKDFRDRF